MEMYKKTVYDPVNDDDILNNDHSEQTHLISILMEKVADSAVRVSSTQLGQFAIRQADNLLWSAEKTAKWSCTPEELGELRLKFILKL